MAETREGPPGAPTPLPGAELGRWNFRVWALAGPFILANLSTPLLGAADTAVMGTLPSPTYIGGVAVGSIIFDFLFWGCSFLRMGTTGFTAQAHGAGQSDELRAVLARALLLAVLLGLLLILLQAPIRFLALHFIEASAEVEANATTYYAIRIWAAPATLVNYVAIGWLMGLHRARAVLALQVLLNGLNIGLDVWFVLGLGWSVEGVAAASLIAEVFAAAVGLLLVRRALGRQPGRWSWPDILRRDRLLGLLRANLDIMVRTLCLVLGFYYMTAKGAAMGDVVLAANTVLIRFEGFMAHGLDGFAVAVEILAGSAYGARHRQAFRAAVLTATAWAFALALVIAALFWLLGPWLVGLFTVNVPEVRSAGIAFLPWIIAAPAVAVWPYMLDGIFVGTTRTGAMRNAMIASLAVFLVISWLLIPAWGNDGLWAAFLVFLGARAVSLGLCYPALERSIEAPPRGHTPEM